MPESRDQYIHRLGRTGRAGSDGKGWLVLSEWESPFLRELNGVEIPVNDRLREVFESPMSTATENILQPVLDRIRKGDKLLAPSAKGAYQAFLGYYLGQMKRINMERKEDLVAIANDFAFLTGLDELPELPVALVGKMGLKGVAGLNVAAKVPNDRDDRRGGGRNDSRESPSSRARTGPSDGRRAPNSDRSRYSRGR
jgi:ATP-dependent RNA helicase MSS116, mitochondrial